MERDSSERVSEVFTCYKCTREGRIEARTLAGCIRIANLIGWRSGPLGFVCGFCPGGGSRRMKLAEAEALEAREMVIIPPYKLCFEDQAGDGRIAEMEPGPVLTIGDSLGKPRPPARFIEDPNKGDPLERVE